jgi:hypothetical protein
MGASQADSRTGTKRISTRLLRAAAIGRSIAAECPQVGVFKPIDRRRCGPNDPGELNLVNAEVDIRAPSEFGV